jgi:hypothetical protein
VRYPNKVVKNFLRHYLPEHAHMAGVSVHLLLGVKHLRVVLHVCSAKNYSPFNKKLIFENNLFGLFIFYHLFFEVLPH